jgi:hypothetical protein
MESLDHFLVSHRFGVVGVPPIISPLEFELISISISADPLFFGELLNRPLRIIAGIKVSSV